ncbi:helix-turn-helix transcriptional regulator [Aquimarina gracilis]|uniref:Helix-turn-helix transcriptional regulator n=1 Tax=Aquimarina gracilis TaxID=874422 RepID=A0ABU5ZQY4_9FLAO|nr:helix-turn-helix transcriptional regulator [Aquimarina gracilis]MEB3344485.1 helix-turn-helix transcriptional regulator [Aquimarina gracilis]
MSTSIKTYEFVDRSDTHLSFDIKRMEDVYDSSRGKLDDPHRHNFFTVLFIKTANGKHMIDFNEYELEENQVFFVSPGQVHQLNEHQKSYGWAIIFSRQFLEENNIDYCFIEDINLFTAYGETPPLYLNSKQQKQLDHYCRQLFEIQQSNVKFKSQAQGALLKLFLIACNNICTLDERNTQQLQAGATILKDFKNLVERHFSEWHLVQQYAEALHVTPDHLNRTIKSLIGKTAKEYLQSRIIIAAKRMLFFSDQTTKEIAYALGFSEPSNFSNFFKKSTGTSPSAFKNNGNVGF